MPGKRPLAVMLSLAMLAASMPGQPRAQDREELTLQLMSTPPAASSTTIAEAQKELHRLRCYWGEINGAWTVSTRAAAQKFVDRVNARLPVDAPDGALLALLRSETSAVCGECPAGQAADTSGRCLPAALLKKQPRPTAVETGSLATTKTETTAPAEKAAPREAASPPRPAEHKQGSSEQAASGSQRAASKPTYWSKLMGKIDKVLGFN